MKKLKAIKQPPKQQPTPASTSTTPKKPRKDNKWVWKDILLKAGEPTTRLFEGEQYHVNFPYHKNLWVRHTSEECFQNLGNATSANHPASSVHAATPSALPRLQRAQLAAALLEESDGSDYEGA